MTDLLKCLFCAKLESNVYEINGNSILIDNEVVDIEDILYELFFRKVK